MFSDDEVPTAEIHIAGGQVKTLSSQNIAELCVLWDIKAVLDEAGIDALRFERVYLGGNGQERTCYHLPRLECDLVMSGYSVPYRLAIIRRWHELEAKEAAPAAKEITIRESLVLNLELLDKNEQQAQQLQIKNQELAAKDEQLEEQRPKVRAFDKLMNAKGLYGAQASRLALCFARPAFRDWRWPCSPAIPRFSRLALCFEISVPWSGDEPLVAEVPAHGDQRPSGHQGQTGGWRRRPPVWVHLLERPKQGAVRLHALRGIRRRTAPTAPSPVASAPAGPGQGGETGRSTATPPPPPSSGGR